MHSDNFNICMFLGNQGNRWIRAQYNVAPNSGNFQLVFEGLRANGYQGDIAIDDVKVNTGKCGSGNLGWFILCTIFVFMISYS